MIESRSSQNAARSVLEIGKVVFRVADRSGIFPTHAQVKRQIGLDLPIILEKESIVFGPQIPLGICWPAGLGIGVDLFEDRRVIGHIPEQMHDVEWPGHAAQVVVVLFRNVIEPRAESVIAGGLGKLVAEVVAVFNEDRGSSGSLGRTEA